MIRIIDTYANATTQLSVLEGVDGMVVSREITLSSEGMLGAGDLSELYPKLGETITRLYDNVQQVSVRQDGHDYAFELGHLSAQNPDKHDKRTRLRGASFQGSLTENIGNGIETSLDHLLLPHMDVVYAASMGMGVSGAISRAERKYFRRYGRLVYEDEYGKTQPLPVLSAFRCALKDVGVEVITDTYSDSAGAVMINELGAVQEPGHVRTSHQNARPGIWDRGVLELAKGMLWTDKIISDDLAATSPDALRMCHELAEFGRIHRADRPEQRGLRHRKSPVMLAAYPFALGKGPANGDPLVADNIALVNNNPEVSVLLTIADQDVLGVKPLLKKDVADPKAIRTHQEDVRRLEDRMHDIASRVSAVGGSRVMAAILSGGNHGVQTHYPQYLREVNAVALR